jgi:general secretion pathway protein I
MPCTRQQGFSLLETLVAFLILSLSLGVLAQIFSRGALALATGQTTNQAVILAESLRTSAVHEPGGGMPSQGSRDGLQWHVRSEPYHAGLDTMGGMQPANTGGFTLQRVVVEVRWHERGGERRLELNSLQPVFEP